MIQVIDLGPSDVILLQAEEGIHLTSAAQARLTEQWGMAVERGIAVIDGAVTVTVFRGVRRWELPSRQVEP